MKSFEQYIHEARGIPDPKDPKIAELIRYLEAPPFNYVIQPHLLSSPNDNDNSYIRLTRVVNKNIFNSWHADGISSSPNKGYIKCNIWTNTIGINYPSIDDPTTGRAIYFSEPDKLRNTFKDMNPHNTFWLTFTVLGFSCNLDSHFYKSNSGVEAVLGFCDHIKPMFEGYNAYVNYPNPDDYVGHIVAYMAGVGLSKVDQLKFKQKMGVLKHDEIGDEDMIGML